MVLSCIVWTIQYMHIHIQNIMLPSAYHHLTTTSHLVVSGTYIHVDSMASQSSNLLHDPLRHVDQ